MRGVGRRIAVAATLFAMLWLAAGVLSDVHAKEGPPALHVDPVSGAPGQTFTLTGERFAAGATYQLLICPPADAAGTPCGYSGANLVGLAQFTAAPDGTVPAGTTGVIPDLLAGTFRIEAIGGAGVVASTPFTVSAPSLTVSTASGASGASIGVGGTGFAPGASYTVCLAGPSAPSCGGTGILLGDISADAGGTIQGGSVTLPGAAPGGYTIGVYLQNGNNTFIASQAFTFSAPSLQLLEPSGVAGAKIDVAGGGYAIGAGYVLCLVPAGATQCGGIGTYVGTFTADSSGAIPAGTLATIPTPAQSSLGIPGSYSIGVLLQSSTAVLLVEAPFTITSGTLPPATPSLQPATAAPAATSAPTIVPAAAATASGDASGLLWLLLLVVLIVAIAVVLWWRRRSRAPSRS